MKYEDVFESEIDGKITKFVFRKPTLSDQQEAQKVYNTTFAEAIKSKALLRAKLDDFVREQGLWDDNSEAKLKELQKTISDGEMRLAKGGFKLSEARNLALEMKKLRIEVRDLLADRISYDSNTAEGQADNARFNYLVSVCTLYAENKQPYFSNYEDFLSKNGIDDIVSVASQNLANILYGLDNDYEDSLPENEFLKEFNFVDKKLRLVDKKGRLITEDGRLINEKNQYVDEDGNPVDINGNPLDEKGHIKADRVPFLDEEDKPIIKEEIVEQGKENTEEVEVKSEETQSV